MCPSEFKTQKYCDMLRKICPEIESSTPGDIKSARYSYMVTSELSSNLHEVMEDCKTHSGGRCIQILYLIKSANTISGNVDVRWLMREERRINKERIKFSVFRLFL